jgi:hypothetical protein
MCVRTRVQSISRISLLPRSLHFAYSQLLYCLRHRQLPLLRLAETPDVRPPPRHDTFPDESRTLRPIG